MKFRSLKTFLFEDFFLLISLWLDFVFMIATLEIFLPNHTWNIIISFKPYFVIIKIEINQTLVSQPWVTYFLFFKTIFNSFWSS